MFTTAPVNSFFNCTEIQLERSSGTRRSIISVTARIARRARGRIGPHSAQSTHSVTETITSHTLNRLSVNDSRDQSDYAPNALNQYQNVAGGDIYYDDKFNLMWTGGFSAGYDSENHLTAIGSGEDYGQFVYDGLGRCLKRTIDWET